MADDDFKRFLTRLGPTLSQMFIQFQGLKLEDKRLAREDEQFEKTFALRQQESEARRTQEAFIRDAERDRVATATQERALAAEARANTATFQQTQIEGRQAFEADTRAFREKQFDAAQDARTTALGVEEDARRKAARREATAEFVEIGEAYGFELAADFMPFLLGDDFSDGDYIKFLAGAQIAPKPEEPDADKALQFGRVADYNLQNGVMTEETTDITGKVTQIPVTDDKGGFVWKPGKMGAFYKQAHEIAIAEQQKALGAAQQPIEQAGADLEAFMAEQQLEAEKTAAAADAQKTESLGALLGSEEFRQDPTTKSLLGAAKTAFPALRPSIAGGKALLGADLDRAFTQLGDPGQFLRNQFQGLGDILPETNRGRVLRDFLPRIPERTAVPRR